VGYLGNEEGVESSLAAYAIGASLIEKPFTLDRHLRGPFHAVCAGREELRSLVRSMRSLEKSLRPVSERKLLDTELENFTRQRVSLVASQDLKAGTVLQLDFIAIKAGLAGISPRLLNDVVGKRVIYDVPAGAPITFGVVAE
jgi:sialic acid synthase SpsE